MISVVAPSLLPEPIVRILNLTYGGVMSLDLFTVLQISQPEPVQADGFEWVNWSFSGADWSVLSGGRLRRES